MNGLLYTGGSQMKAGGTLRFLIALATADFAQRPPPTHRYRHTRSRPTTTHWDITAKVPMTGEGAPNVVGGRTPAPSAQCRPRNAAWLMLDQFELKTHSENREVTVYALTFDGE